VGALWRWCGWERAASERIIGDVGSESQGKEKLMASAKRPGSSRRRYMVMLVGAVVAALMLASTGAAWAAGGSEDNRRPVIKDLSPAPAT
jgi:hypothetical protein